MMERFSRSLKWLAATVATILSLWIAVPVFANTTISPVMWENTTPTGRRIWLQQGSGSGTKPWGWEHMVVKHDWSDPYGVGDGSTAAEQIVAQPSAETDTWHHTVVYKWFYNSLYPVYPTKSTYIMLSAWINSKYTGNSTVYTIITGYPVQGAGASDVPSQVPWWINYGFYYT